MSYGPKLAIRQVRRAKIRTLSTPSLPPTLMEVVGRASHTDLSLTEGAVRFCRRELQDLLF